MRQALRLAERGRGRTRPNPVVGAVAVRGGRVVGAGWHRGAGLPHAEVVALEQAGREARGSTLYVTLEPCAHHGRTPPCVEAILDAGVRRCVVAMRDPHRIVDGRGLAALRAAGVRVELGLLGEEARRTLAGYLSVHRLGVPRITWKVAATFDGRVADARGRSKWITGPAARAATHVMRAGSDAIVIGGGTARADDPRLTVRVPGARRAGRVDGVGPLRVVCSRRIDLPLGLRLFRPALARGTVVACLRSAPVRRVAALEARGVEVWQLPGGRDGVSPRALAQRLARAGCHDVLLESGPGLGGAFVRAGLVRHIAAFMAPRLLGAPGMPWLGAIGAPSLADARAGRIVRLETVGADALLEMEIDP